MSEKEHIEDVPHGSAKEQEVLEAVQASFLDRQFDSNWRPAKVQLITNDTIIDEYEEKKQDFLIRGRKGEELTERCGFFVENNVAILEFLTRLGLQARDSEYNALGYNRMGIYLCKHADVGLQHALVKHSGSLVMRMVMCKYIAGRSTTAIPRVASAAEFIEPTQGFDSHESVINPDPRDSLQNKFDRSQVYLYEINKLLQPCSRPRQVLPFAVVSFTQNGAYLPAIDAEATAAERMASSIAQQNIANIINSKETLAAQPGASAATAPTVASIPTAMPNPGPGLIPGPPVAVSPQLPPGSVAGPALIPAGLQVSEMHNHGPGLISGPQVAGTPQFLPRSVVAGPALMPAGRQVQTSTNVLTSPPLRNGVNGDSPSPGIPLEENRDPLKNVVSQLNVKLGPEVKTRSGRESVHRSSMASPAVPIQQGPTVVSAAHYAGQYSTTPLAVGGPRFMHLGNGLPPGMLPPGTMLAGGAAGFPGMFPGQIPGLQGIPGQPGLIPAQPGLLPSPHPMMVPMGAPSPIVRHALHTPNNIQGIPSFPGMFGMATVQSFPGAGLMGSVPGVLPGHPAIHGALPAHLQGALPQTRSPSGQQLGQSRPITPEVPTAGYVANNVSGYTPAIYGAAPGQPIPVLTNGTVQANGQVSLSQQIPVSQAGMVSMAGQMAAMQGLQTFQALPGLPPGTPGAAGLAGMTSMANMSVGGFPAGMTSIANMMPTAITSMATMSGYPAGLASMANMGALPPGMSYIPAGLAAAAPTAAPQGAPMQQFAAYPYLGAYGQQFLPQKLPGQNGLLQQAAVPVQGVAVAAAPSLKRPMADPYGVIDKRLRLA